MDGTSERSRLRQELAIGAIFGDGEPNIRVSKIDIQCEWVSLLSVSIIDRDQVVGFAASIHETGREIDGSDIEVLKTKVRQLGGECRLVDRRTLRLSEDASTVLVRTLLSLQRNRSQSDASPD